MISEGSFFENLQHDAQIVERESPRQHGVRLLEEVYEDTSAGFQSREETVAALAKLAIVLEVAASTHDAGLRLRAEELRSDIAERYPDAVE